MPDNLHLGLTEESAGFSVKLDFLIHIYIGNFGHMATTRRFNKFIYLRDHASILASTRQPVEYWIHPDEIASFQIACPRTPVLTIRLRSRPDERGIEVRGTEATALLNELRRPKA